MSSESLSSESQSAEDPSAPEPSPEVAAGDTTADPAGDLADRVAVVTGGAGGIGGGISRCLARAGARGW